MRISSLLSRLAGWAGTLMGAWRNLPAELPGGAPRWARSSYVVVRRLEIRVLFIGLATVLCFWGFVALADEVTDGPLGVDRWVYDVLHDDADPLKLPGPAWLPNTIRDFTALGSSAIMLPLVGVVALGLWAAGRRRLPLLVLGACLSGMLLGPALKRVIDRDRPGEEFRSVATFTSSFPSGHTTNAAVVYLTLGALIAQGQRRKRVALFALATGIGVAVLVGLSRIFLGVHWPTDVLGGWAAGFGWATLWWLIADFIRAWKPPATPAPPAVPSAPAA